jgi:hypothetical protein
MEESGFMNNTRNRGRVKAVLPVRISGNDASGDAYTELAHTLDITPSGVRLGSIYRQLEVGGVLTLQYKQYKAEFRVVWIKQRQGRKEHHVGLEALNQNDFGGLGSELWARSHITKSPVAPPQVAAAQAGV